eukprot:gene9738-13139_t
MLCRALLWVDIVAPSVNYLDTVSGKNVSLAVPAKIGSATAMTGGGALLALERELWLSQPDTVLHRHVAPPMGATHFNDGKCDAAGRFWLGSRSSDGSPGKGVLYRLDPDGALHAMARGFDVCNGLGWSPDGRSFYLVDTVPRLLYRYDFDSASGTIANRSVVQTFAGIPGKPDGLAVDAEGRIWCAMWDGAGIALLSDNGAWIGWLDTPCPRPTSCAFGGEEGEVLFVTTASFGLDPADAGRFGRSGEILAFAAGVAGVPRRKRAGDQSGARALNASSMLLGAVFIAI